ncbi:MAG: DODA-type extradiol aromatic ring-opening family dioxygenase [Kiloniellaceae bacterium]
MSERPLPSLFVSHGPPTMVLDDIPVRGFLARLGRELPRPRAVLCASAHWFAERPTVSLAERPETIHDFYGFDRALYEIRYPAPGEPDLARRAAALLEAAGIDCALDPARGLDHGAWEPLMLMYPQADVPVVQLSLQRGADVAAHLRIGRALAPLRREDVLVLASGTAVHNLAQWRADSLTTPAWAIAFEDWLVDAVTAGDDEAVANYQRRAPDAALAHPTEDHFLPLPVAMGAGGPDGSARVLHRGFSYGSLSMAAFAFGGEARGGR